MTLSDGVSTVSGNSVGLFSLNVSAGVFGVTVGSVVVSVIASVRENGDLSVQQAEEVLKVLSLSAANKGLYENTQASCAPLIKISSSQYIHSCAGSLYRPFSFMLDNITILYPNICDKNRNKREAVFRNQLYEMMPNFHCIDHQIVIKKNGQRITDIDAAAIDYETGEIALFQLKWQDHTSLSPKTLIWFMLS